MLELIKEEIKTNEMENDTVRIIIIISVEFNDIQAHLLLIKRKFSRLMDQKGGNNEQQSIARVTALFCTYQLICN